MPDVETSPSMRARARRALTALGLAGLLAAAAVGGDLFGLRERLLGSAAPNPRPAATGFVAVPSGSSARETVLRSQPWWQHLQRLSGDGSTSARLPIDRSAIQWRARWICREGRLVVRATGEDGPVVDAACPGEGTAYATRPGATTARVEASGRWALRVDQQVDVPLDRPPLPAMTRPAATGRLYRIDQTATGRATFYRLAAGSFALRLADFYITPNVDLELRLSPLREPKTTREFLSARSVLIAPLPITTGSLNFRVPRGVDPTRYRSLVVWCPPTRNAYGAASLR